MDYYLNLSLDNIVEEFEGAVYTEEWMFIEGTYNLYQISTFGRVKSLNPSILYPNNKNGTILRQNFNKKGYLLCYLYIDKKKKTIAVHRIVATHFSENNKNLAQVNHKHGNKKDNRYHQLEWMSCRENIQHAFDTGIKSLSGEKHVKALFTNKQVVEFRNRYDNGETVKSIAESQNCKRDTMSKIVKRIHYHI